MTTDPTTTPWEPTDLTPHLDRLDEATRALADAVLGESGQPVRATEQAGYVLLRGVTSPAGTEQWQAVSGIHQERHLGYLQRLRTEQQESHPEDFWRFEIATVTIPGVAA